MSTTSTTIHKYSPNLLVFPEGVVAYLTMCVCQRPCVVKPVQGETVSSSTTCLFKATNTVQVHSGCLSVIKQSWRNSVWLTGLSTK